MVYSLRAVHRPIDVIRVIQRDLGLDELVHGLTAQAFTGVLGIGFVVTLPREVQHPANANEPESGIPPRLFRRDVQQGQEAKCGTFILLRARQTKRRENLD